MRLKLNTSMIQKVDIYNLFISCYFKIGLIFNGAKILEQNQYPSIMNLSAL